MNKAMAMPAPRAESVRTMFWVWVLFHVAPALKTAAAAFEEWAFAQYHQSDIKDFWG